MNVSVLSGGQTFYHLNIKVHVYKVTPDFVWGRLSRKLVGVMRPRWALKWRSVLSESISLCLPGTGWTHIFIKTSQSAMMSKKARTPSSRFRPAVLIGDCDLSFLSVCSVRRLKHVCPRLFRLLVCLFLGTVVTVKTLIITLLPPLLSFWEYRFLFHIFQLFYSRPNPSVNIQLLVCPRWSEPTRSNLFALVVVSLHCQVWIYEHINCKTFITDITDHNFMRSGPMFIICVRLETIPNWSVRHLFFFF